MSFEDGNEDELLLTCIVCKSPFGMVSQYCGECGANRLQALGVERARPSQRVSLAKPTEPIVPQPYDRDSVGIGKTESPPTKARKPSRLSVMRANNSMRIEHLAFTLQYHGKKVIAVGLFIFLLFSYVTFQSFIYLGSAPDNEVNQYITAVSERDSQYFTNSSAFTPNLKKIPLMPSKYNTWKEAQAASWINSYSWNGWLHKGVAHVQPGIDQPTIDLPLIPKEKRRWLVFRDSQWQIKGPISTVHIAYPKNSSLPIFINGIYAGTVGNPDLAPGTYYALPGPLQINFAGNGQTTAYDVDIFIYGNGEYTVTDESTA